MNYKKLIKLINEAYLPAVQVNRHIHLPLPTPRSENDTEHSFSLALVASALAPEVGLDPGKCALYAIYHDLIEIYSGDVSLWDKKGYKTKTKREASAIKQINKEFDEFPLISEVINGYETLADEEARFVFALDKLIPLLIHLISEGHFNKTNKITFEDHLQKVVEVRPKVAVHPKVLEWWSEAEILYDSHKDDYFYESKGNK